MSMRAYISIWASIFVGRLSEVPPMESIASARAFSKTYCLVLMFWPYCHPSEEVPMVVTRSPSTNVI